MNLPVFSEEDGLIRVIDGECRQIGAQGGPRTGESAGFIETIDFGMNAKLGAQR